MVERGVGERGAIQFIEQRGFYTQDDVTALEILALNGFNREEGASAMLGHMMKNGSYRIVETIRNFVQMTLQMKTHGSPDLFDEQFNFNLRGYTPKMRRKTQMYETPITSDDFREWMRRINLQ